MEKPLLTYLFTLNSDLQFFWTYVNDFPIVLMISGREVHRYEGREKELVDNKLKEIRAALRELSEAQPPQQALAEL